MGSFNGIYKNSGLDYVRQKTWNRAAKVAEELSLPLIQLNSNIHQVFPQNHLLTHTYTDIFAVYSLQRLWKTYYYASTYSFAYFHLENNLRRDPSSYELLLLNCFSTSELRLYLDGADGDRIDKVAYIADFPIAQKYLHVCTSKEVNCCYCEKCKRTLLSLDALGKLDNFKESFDIGRYKTERPYYYHFLCEQFALQKEFYKTLFERLYPLHKEEFDRYLSEFTFEKQYKKAKELQRRLDKWRIYTATFKKAINEKAFKEKIVDFFKTNNVSKIAFYGDGELRRYLYAILKDIVEVKYIIEDGKFDWLPFPSYKRTDSDLPRVDLIIITDPIGANQIKKMLERSYSFQIVKAEDLFEL